MLLALQLKQVLHDTWSLCSHAFFSYELWQLFKQFLAFPAPTGPPETFTVTRRRARNMTFSWSPPTPTLRNGVITGYFLSCVPEGGGGSSISMQYTAAGTFTLRGFTPFTSYNCSVSASNSWGSGPTTYLIDTTLEARKQLRQ